MSEPLYDPTVAKKVARADLFDRLWKVVSVIALIVLAVILVQNTAQIRATQINGTPTGKAILESNEAIKSCVLTTGECYKRGQANQAKAISTLADLTVFAVVCGQRLPDAPVSEVQACVARLAAKP